MEERLGRRLSISARREEHSAFSVERNPSFSAAFPVPDTHSGIHQVNIVSAEPYKLAKTESGI